MPGLAALAAVVLGFISAWWAIHDIEMIALGVGWSLPLGVVIGRRSRKGEFQAYQTALNALTGHRPPQHRLLDE